MAYIQKSFYFSLLKKSFTFFICIPQFCSYYRFPLSYPHIYSQKTIPTTATMKPTFLLPLLLTALPLTLTHPTNPHVANDAKTVCKTLASMHSSITALAREYEPENKHQVADWINEQMGCPRGNPLCNLVDAAFKLLGGGTAEKGEKTVDSVFRKIEGERIYGMLEAYFGCADHVST